MCLNAKALAQPGQLVPGLLVLQLNIMQGTCQTLNIGHGLQGQHVAGSHLAAGFCKPVTLRLAMNYICCLIVIRLSKP